MTIDYTKPVATDLYDSATQPDVLEYIRDNMAANAKMLEGMDPTGKQTGFKRINAGQFEEWNGSAWAVKTLAYVPKTGASDITGNLGISVSGFASFSAQVPNAPVNKRNTFMAGQADGQSYFAQLNDAGNAWTAGMRIGTDGKLYDIASGKALVTNEPAGAYLPLTGGTLTGDLALAPVAGECALYLVQSASINKTVYFKTGGWNRWAVSSNATAEAGSNAGSDFAIDRYNDAGVYLSTPFFINRSNGGATFGSTTNFNGGIVSGGNVAVTNGNALFLLASNGAQKIINSANNNVVATLDDGGMLNMFRGYAGRQGAGGTVSSSVWNYFWTGAALQVWVDTTNLGFMSIAPSDERIKHRIEPLAMDTDAFHRIKPIRYHYADVSIFRDDGRERHGFSAQNLKTALPQAVTGDIDAVQDNGDPQPAGLDTTAILAQTVLQVQDLLKRIAALEARVK
jgi:hypothetical protein